jgi:hypothetical protein
LFDSSYEDVNKTYGKYDENRADKLFLFKQEKKDGMIRILEGLSLMSYGDKVLFIPSNLLTENEGWCYTAKRNPDFEMEMLENQQVQNNKQSL